MAYAAHKAINKLSSTGRERLLAHLARVYPQDVVDLCRELLESDDTNCRKDLRHGV